jgi:hypothetical protein
MWIDMGRSGPVHAPCQLRCVSRNVNSETMGARRATSKQGGDRGNGHNPPIRILWTSCWRTFWSRCVQPECACDVGESAAAADQRSFAGPARRISAKYPVNVLQVRPQPSQARTKTDIPRRRSPPSILAFIRGRPSQFGVATSPARPSRLQSVIDIWFKQQDSSHCHMHGPLDLKW